MRFGLFGNQVSNIIIFGEKRKMVKTIFHLIETAVTKHLR